MNSIETATFANGCFWCTEAIFKRLKGVISVESGYTGGTSKNPSYEDVCSGQTGHAEAIRITFNPQIISYDTLLDIFWHSHNPTTKDRQGNDVGTQYRSAIFYHTQQQNEKAQHSKRVLEKENIYTTPIVTEIVSAQEFYPAESYHMNYYDSNLSKPYCSLVISPKIQKLLEQYTDQVKDEYLQ